MAVQVLALRILKSIVGVLGLIGNTTVVTVIYNVNFMHTITDAFICNHAVVDCLGSLLLILTSNIIAPERLPDTPWYGFVCYFWSSHVLYWACFNSSTISLLALVCERYIALEFPLKYRSIYTKRSLVAIIVAVWLLGLIFQVVVTAAIMTFEDGLCMPSASVASKIMNIITIAATFFLPSLVMTFVFCHLATKLKRRRTNATVDVPSLSQGVVEPLNRARRLTLKTLFILFATFLICCTLNQVLFLMFNFGWSFSLAGPLHTVSVALIAMNSCVNPFIFAFKYKRFRRALSALVHGSSFEEGQSIQPTNEITLQTHTPHTAKDDL